MDNIINVSSKDILQFFGVMQWYEGTMGINLKVKYRNIRVEIFFSKIHIHIDLFHCCGQLLIDMDLKSMIFQFNIGKKIHNLPDFIEDVRIQFTPHF